MTEMRINVLANGNRGTEPHFGRPSSTRSEAPAPAPRPQSDAHGLVEWLASPAARQFEGRWVLLSDDYDVVDSADSPSELMDRHPEERTPIVVFVRPSNVTYVI